jgi:hypothetical protein
MVDRNRLLEELRRMKELIRTDPQVLAQFDRDGNGVIDGEEWEEVRQLVTRRLEREEAEAEEAQSLAAAAGQEQPGQAQAMAAGVVAQDILEGDLADRSGQGGSLTDARVLVLEQQGGLGQLVEGMSRREYTICSGDGTHLGVIQQQQNEMLQNLGSRSIFDVPDLDFRVVDNAGNTIIFRRSQGMASEQIDVLDGGGGQLGYVKWKLSLLGRKFHVVSTLDRGALTVKTNLLKPFTLQVLDHDDNEVGRIERGWSGLGGFLTGGNRMRIQLKKSARLSAGQRWGLLAAALLADLGAERKNKRDNDGISLFGE